MENTTKIILASVVIASIIVAGILIYTSLTIHNYGEIITVGVDCNTRSIDWGKLYPNTTKQAVIEVWGNGSVPITATLTVGNWTPAIAGEYLACTWNYSGEIIGTAHMPIAITMHVDEGVQGFTNFSFDLVIQAKEAT